MRASLLTICVHHRRRDRLRRHCGHLRRRRGSHRRRRSAVRSTIQNSVRHTKEPTRSCARYRSETTHSCVLRSSLASTRSRVQSCNSRWTNSPGCCPRSLRKPSTTAQHGTNIPPVAVGLSTLSHARTTNCRYASRFANCSGPASTGAREPTNAALRCSNGPAYTVASAAAPSSCSCCGYWPSARCDCRQSLPCSRSAGQSCHCRPGDAARCATALRCWIPHCSSLPLTVAAEHCALPDCSAHWRALRFALP
jgi:hypothetical protein